MPETLEAKTKLQQDIREYYLQILFKRKKIFFTPLFCALFIAILGCLFVPKEYEAGTTILVEEKSTLSGAIRGIVVSTPLRNRIRTIREEILSWSRIVEVVRELGMDVGIESPRELEMLVKKIQSKIFVRQKGSDVIQIAFRGRDPLLVQNFVNTMTQKYIEKNLKAERLQTYNAIDFLEEQLEDYRKRIRDSEKKLGEFRTKNIASLSVSADIIFEEMVKRQMETENLSLQILNVQEQISSIDRQLSGEQDLVFSETVTDLNPVIAELKSRLQGLQSQLSQMELRYTEKHPSVIKTKGLIELTRNQMKLEADKVLQSDSKSNHPVYLAMVEQKNRLQVKLNSLVTRQKSIEGVIEQQEMRIQTIPQSQQTLAELSRGVEVNQKMYDQLLSRLEQSKISQQLEATDRGARFEILDPARFPQSPVGPNKVKFLFVGFFIGIAIGGGLLYLSEVLDHSFRGVSDASQHLSLSIIGTIPSIVTQRDLAKETRNLVFLLLCVLIFMVLATVVVIWISHLMLKYNIG